MILGVSARAAAESAARGGFAPVAVDLFGDVDLGRVAESHVATGYPLGLFDVARSLPNMPWLYTGGLENCPDLVDRLASDRPLLGNSGEALRRARDPLELAALAQEAGLPWPNCRGSVAGVPQDGSWLVKDRFGSGGRHVAVWRGQSLPAGDRYWQQRIFGTPCAAVYVADGDRALLLGATQQWIGQAWLGGRDFWYCGSVGPLPYANEAASLSAAAPGSKVPGAKDPGAKHVGPRVSASALQELGDALTRRLRLRGLFGVDGVLQEDRFYPVELNPRFPASVEILERLGRFSAVGLHVEACTRGLASDRLKPFAAPTTAPRMAGKAILYARQAVRIDEAQMRDWLAARSPDYFSAETSDEQNIVGAHDRECVWIADIPNAGSEIAAGRPVMTLLAAGSDRASVARRLESAANHAYRRWTPAVSKTI